MLFKKILGGMIAAVDDWIYKDDFLETIAAGSVLNTPSTPGPGTRTVVDTAGNLLSIDGDKDSLVISQRTGTSDPGIWLPAVVRESGRLAIWKIRWGDNSCGGRLTWGFDSNQAGAPIDALSNVATAIRGYVNETVLTISPYRYYYFANILKATGSYLFIYEKAGYPNWTLLWSSEHSAATPVYPTLSVHNLWGGTAVNDIGMIRVPKQKFLPEPLLYETFAADNGTSLDALASHNTGPENQPATSRTGTEQAGDWDIQSNRANPDGAGIHTWDVGQADIFIDLVVNGGAAGNPGIVFRYTDANNYWYLQADRANNLLELHEMNGGVDTVRDSAAVTINDSTDYTLRLITRAQKIYGWINNTQDVTWTSAALNETETKHGLYADDSACEFDDLIIFASNYGHNVLKEYANIGFTGSYTSRAMKIEPANLILYHKLDEASGAVANDVSSQGNDGVLSNVVLGETSFGDGLTCAKFVRTSSPGNDIHTAGFAADWDGEEWSFSCVFKLLDPAMWRDGIQYNFFTLSVDANNYIYLCKSVGNDLLGFVYMAGGVNKTDHIVGCTDTGFVHMGVTVSKADDIMKTYHNGIQKQQETGLGAWAGAPVSAYIGSSGGAGYFNGWLAHCMIWNKAIRPDQMYELGWLE